MNIKGGLIKSVNFESRNKFPIHDMYSFTKNPHNLEAHLIVTLPENTSRSMNIKTSHKFKNNTINSIDYSSFRTRNSSKLPLLNEKYTKVSKPMRVVDGKLNQLNTIQKPVLEKRKKYLKKVILNREFEGLNKYNNPVKYLENSLKFKEVFNDVYKNNNFSSKEILEMVRKEVEEKRMKNDWIDILLNKKPIFKSYKDLEKINERKDLLFFYVKFINPIQHTGNIISLLNDGAYLQTVFKENTSKFRDVPKVIR